ncbi:MAG: DUF983 domain-containing protein [Flavobacteriales bacterium]|nr:DUF983 domain-containing protein [Flavobacteriales bacterium]
MKESCSHCGHIYEWEPGFFYGAMYVSYALGVATLVGVFIICQFFFERAFDPWMIAWMIGTLLALAPYNHKISRVIWMYFFTRKGRSKTLVQQK